MKAKAVVAVVALGAALALAGAARSGEQGAEPVGKVVAVTGDVQIGSGESWSPVEAEQQLFDGQVLRAGAESTVEVVFAPDTPARLDGAAEIAVADLLLKAGLEKARGRIAEPADTRKAELEVRPLTGVRGTDKTEEKAADTKREHYWNENPPAGQ